MASQFDCPLLFSALGERGGDMAGTDIKTPRPQYQGRGRGRILRFRSFKTLTFNAARHPDWYDGVSDSLSVVECIFGGQQKSYMQSTEV